MIERLRPALRLVSFEALPTAAFIERSPMKDRRPHLPDINATAISRIELEQTTHSVQKNPRGKRGYIWGYQAYLCNRLSVHCNILSNYFGDRRGHQPLAPRGLETLANGCFLPLATSRLASSIVAKSRKAARNNRTNRRAGRASWCCDTREPLTWIIGCEQQSASSDRGRIVLENIVLWPSWRTARQGNRPRLARRVECCGPSNGACG